MSQTLNSEMKTQHLLSTLTIIYLAIFVLSNTSCNKSDSESYTITVGAYTQDSIGNYIFTGNELIFDSNAECQIWSRTAPGDSHSSSSHLHYNAAANVSYDESNTTFSWTEYGPELDQESIETTCSNATGGVNKTVTNSSYYQDKPNLYLKIISVVEN